MWNGKKKAVTFSFDDGITQDFEVIKMLDKYNLKATFNLNSSLFGLTGELPRENSVAPYNHIEAKDIRETYKGHELAVHTLTHPALCLLNEDAIVWQVEQDRKTLETFCDYPIECMAYPGGNVDERVVNILKTKTKIKFSRGVQSTYNFDLQDELLNFKPTIHWEDPRLLEVVENFLNTESEKPQLLYIWGHAYELDFDVQRITREKFEKVCKLLSNKDDIFYGTNSEVLLKK